MKMTKKYYIAYGSNLNISQMKTRCPDAKIVGKTKLEGWRLLFRGSKTGSYLTIEPKKGYSVPIAVWAVSERDEKNLDRYEGYPSFYYKKSMKVAVKGIKSGKLRNLDAFVYIMHEDRPIGIPSGVYMRTCLEGYLDFDFDMEILMNAYNESREEEKCQSRQ